MSSNRPVPLEHVADPVRRRVLEQLDASEASTVDELADAAGAHPNTVRGHLGALEADGVVQREPLSSGRRGRPRLRYRLGQGWRLPGRDYKALADLFAQSLAALDPSPEQVRRIGREWGRFLGGRPGSSDASELIPPAMHALGFDVEMDADLVRLGGCPCRLVLPQRPELVCQLGAAVIDGLASVARKRLRVASAAHDPAARQCQLQLAAQLEPA
jgi:predicted ArsR family transcriptional regulator